MISCQNNHNRQLASRQDKYSGVDICLHKKKGGWSRTEPASGSPRAYSASRGVQQSSSVGRGEGGIKKKYLDGVMGDLIRTHLL